MTPAKQDPPKQRSPRGKKRPQSSPPVPKQAKARPPTVDPDTKVIVGEAAREGTFRAKIQAAAKHAVTIAHLIETVKVPNCSGKIRNMLTHGLLKRA